MSATVSRLHPTGDSPTVTALVEPALRAADRAGRATSTLTKYRQTLRKLVATHGDRPVDELDAEDLSDLLDELAGDAAARTYNRHRAALALLLDHAVTREHIASSPLEQVQRRKVVRTAREVERGQQLPQHLLDRLWHVETGHPLRDRVLWRLLYDTAARAEELLALDVSDLDLEDRSVVVVGKGGDRRKVRWHVGTHRLLRSYLDGRTTGPLVLTTRRAPTGTVVASDLHDGYARLTHGAAWAAFKDAAGDPWTLHHLRHTRLSHLAEQGWTAEQLQAVSGHRSARTLDTYVHVSDEAVARLYDEHDPDRRA